MGHRVGIYGASGYAGGELIRLVDAHPELDTAVVAGNSTAGSTLAEVHPHLAGGDRVLAGLDPATGDGLDLAFLALPHGTSAVLAMQLIERGVKVADLGSDFRMDSQARFDEAYGTDHPHPEELGAWAYGIPELFSDSIRIADRVAVPGCYPTSAILALGPLLKDGLIDASPIIVDSMSGVSGAGRGAKPHLTFGAVDESVVAYGVLTHRHRPEIEQGLEHTAGKAATVVFTPHLVPMQRGILSTCHAPLAAGATEADLRASLAAAYDGSPFVGLVDGPPQTRWVVGSNRALISPKADPRTGGAVVLSAIDNLMKGAAGQAVQCANLMLGLDESAGLPVDGWMP